VHKIVSRQTDKIRDRRLATILPRSIT